MGDILESDSAIPPELRDACARGELILCVGPELGRRAGLPDMAQLALALVADIESRDARADTASLREGVARGRIAETLEILERRMGTRFQRVAERVLADGGRPLPTLAMSIVGLSVRLRAVYTTGIDRLLERAFVDAWPSFTSPRPDVARRRKLIFKLCGTLEFPDTWVITQAAFEREFGVHSLRRQLMATVLGAQCLLFVGFDPKDGLTQRLFSILDSSLGEVQLPSHFVVLEHCDPDWRTLLERRGLHVVVGESSTILEALGRGDVDREAAISPEFPSCPYPGLQAFDASLAGVFHGRRAEVSQAAARLGGPGSRHRRWLAIDGSSGVGKSSFVHAGLLPALRRGFAEGTPARWSIVAMRPGRRPLRELVGRLKTVLDEAGPALDISSPATLAEFVRGQAPAHGAVLVVVDQLEEIVTLAAPEERSGFVECLVELLQQQLIYLVTTSRSDFNAALTSASPMLARLLNDQAERFTLAPISRVGLRAAIVEPAAQLGVRFEEHLVERIASDAEQHLDCPPDESDGVVRTDDAALPLVAHVLRALWDAHAAGEGVITLAEYRTLGGVSGALSRNADALLGTLDRKQQARVKALLLRMTGIDGDRLTRRTLTRVEAVALAGGSEDGERLLTLLSGAGGPRLLLVRGEAEEALVDLIHEALLREWDTLRGWIAANRAQIARDEALAMRAAGWIGQGRPWRSLPRGSERRELLRGRPHGREAIRQREYQRAMSWAGWLRGGAWVGFVTVLTVLGVFVGLKLESARSLDEQRRNELDDLRDKSAEDDVGSQQAEVRKRIEIELNGHRCGPAMVAILDALDDDPSKQLRSLLREAMRCEAIVGKIAEFDGSAAAVTAVGVAPTGQEIWVGRSNGRVDRWLPSTDRVDAVEGLAQRIDFIEFSPSGDRVALGSSVDGTTTLREAQGQGIGVPFAGSSPQFSPDGRYVATLETRQVNLHDAAKGELSWSASTEGSTMAFEFSPTDVLLLTSSKRQGSEVVTLSLAEGDRVGSLSVPGYVRDIAISSDGRRLASASDDIRLWDLATAGQVESFQIKLRDSSLGFVQYSPNDSMLLALTTNESVMLEDLAGGTTHLIEAVDPHRRPIFSPDGRWLLTSESDGTVNLRNAASGVEVARVEVANLQVMAFSPASDGFITGSADGAVVQWGVHGDDHWRDPTPHDRSIRALVFSPTNPRQLASGSVAGTVHTWSIGATEAATETWRHDAWSLVLAFSADGTRLTSFSNQGVLYGWDANSTAALDMPAPVLCASKIAATSASGQRLAVACPDGKVQLWDSTRPLEVLESSTALTVTAIAVSDQGHRVVLGGSAGAVEILTIESDGRETRDPVVVGHDKAVTSIAFTRAGDRFVTGSNDGFVVRWSLDDRDHFSPSRGLSMEGRNVEAVAISDTPPRVAAGDDSDGTIIVWSDTDEELLYLDAACHHQVTALQFSPDGRMLAAGCSDGTVHAWPIGVESQTELACQRLAHVSIESELPEICLAHED